MDITLKRTSKFDDLSRGRQVKREGQVLGLPTSESKRTKRNPMSSFQNILASRRTITLKKSVLQTAGDRGKQAGEGRDKSAPQGKPGPLKKKTADKKLDQENVDPVSRIPLPQKKTIFGNPFTKKKQTAPVPVPPAPLAPLAPPAPLAPQTSKQNLVKVRVPALKGDTKPNVPLTNGVRATSATSATSRPTEGDRRVVPSSSQIPSRLAVSNSCVAVSNSCVAVSNSCVEVSNSCVAVSNSCVGVSNSCVGVSQRKPLGNISQTYSDSSSSSVSSQLVAVRGVSSRFIPPGNLNQSLNTSFLQTFSNMNTLDQRGHRVLKENPPCGPYLRFSSRPTLQTLRVSDPATSHLLLLPETTELSCSLLKSDVFMMSPLCVPRLGDPLLELDRIGTQFLLCPEYAEGIFSYLKDIESRFMPAANYLSKQQDINEGMRCILVDWLVEVSVEYKFNPQTLFLAVNYIDRFLSCMSVNRSKLQLVGTCCMYVASKFEEIYPPDLTEFAFITEDTYSKRQVVRMEALILKALEFNLLAPTAITFAERYMRAVRPCHNKLKHLVAYLCELALLSENIILRFHPSLVAASAVSLSSETLGLEKWTPSLTRHTGYNWSDIQTCRALLYLQFSHAPNLPQQAVQTKYRSPETQSVSRLSPPLPRN